MTNAVLLPAAERTARPWKNGGGITHDIAVFPPGSGMDDFDWRLSIADVTKDGLFSLFPGVDRHLSVLSGRLCLLRDGEADHVVAEGDPPIAFRGDQRTVGHLLVGPVRDLNLMVRRNAYIGSLYNLPRGTLDCEAATTIVLALADTRVSINDAPVQLRTLDALMLGSGQRIRGCVPLIVAEINRAW